MGHARAGRGRYPVVSPRGSAMKLRAGLLLVCLAGLPAPARAQQPLIESFVLSPVDEGLFRARAPRRHAEFEELRQAGVRTILDVRAFRPFSSRREAHLAAEYGIAYHHYRYPALPWAMGEAEGAF